MATEPLLDPRQVDIWYVRPEKVVAARLLDAYRAKLPPEEVRRAEEFAFERSRIQHLVTRMLVRTVLSHYSGHDLGAWRFDLNAHGKPAVAEPAGVTLAFNLSHTDGLVVCAVTAGCDVGIDVENFRRRTDHLALARRYYAPSESSAVEQAAAADRAEWFLRYWTLKEAYIKARGLGLSIRLADVEFSLARDRPPTPSFHGKVDDLPHHWQFAEIRPGAPHLVAFAVRLAAAEPLLVQIRETIPLYHEGAAKMLPANPANIWSI